MEVEDALGWLMAASAAIWLGLGCYMAWLGFIQAALAKRCRQLELERDEN